MKRIAIINPPRPDVPIGDDPVAFLPMERVSEVGTVDPLLISPDQASSGMTWFQQEDVLIAKITPCFENGKGAHLRELPTMVGVGSTEFHVLRPIPKVSDGRYLYYLTLSPPFCKEAEAHMTGASGQKRVPTDFIANYSFELPPLREQREIAAFLDQRTAQIDRLVQRKQRLLTLLAEYRTAIINRAVTRGLDPNVPMKDSGIEWLGEVPAHWELRALKAVAEVRGGLTKGRNLTGRETVSVPYMRVANVQDGYLKLNDIAYMDVPLDEVGRYALREGDVLMNEGGDFDKLGRGAVWRGQLDLCLHQNHVFAVRPSPAIKSEWLNCLTLTRYAKYYFTASAKQSTNLASLSSSRLKELPALLPPIDEQGAILARLQVDLERIDWLVQKETRLIDLAREYRTSLISEVVAGKLNICESAPIDRSMPVA